MSVHEVLALSRGTAPLGAVLCAGAAAWVATSGSGASHRVVGLRGSEDPPGGGRGRAARRLPPGLTAPPGLVVPLVAAVLAWWAGGVTAGALGAVAAVLLLRRRATVSRARASEAERRARVALCDALASELRAGRSPAAALRAASATAGGTGAEVFRRAAGVAELGGDVAGALRGTEPGERSAVPGVLRQLAACWTVAERSGAGLAPAVQRLADALRAQERQRVELAGEVAGAQVTARLLAVLPGLGLLLAAAVGAQPLAFLLGTPLGTACLVCALGLDLLGLAWTRRLTEGALAGARTGSGGGP